MSGRSCNGGNLQNQIVYLSLTAHNPCGVVKIEPNEQAQCSYKLPRSWKNLQNQIVCICLSPPVSARLILAPAIWHSPGFCLPITGSVMEGGWTCPGSVITQWQWQWHNKLLTTGRRWLSLSCESDWQLPPVAAGGLNKSKSLPSVVSLRVPIPTINSDPPTLLRGQGGPWPPPHLLPLQWSQGGQSTRQEEISMLCNV